MCERVSRVVLDYLHHSPHELETMFVSDGNQDEFIGMTAEEKGIPPLDASELKKMQEVVRVSSMLGQAIHRIEHS